MKNCTCGRCFESTPDYAIAHLDTDPGGWPFSGFYWECPDCKTTLYKPFESILKTFLEAV